MAILHDTPAFQRGGFSFALVLGLDTWPFDQVYYQRFAFENYISRSGSAVTL